MIKPLDKLLYIISYFNPLPVGDDPLSVGTLGSIWRAIRATVLELHFLQVGSRLKVGNN